MQPGFPVATETNGTGSATTPSYAVAATDVVLAFVASDAPAGNAGFSISNRTVSGGTLAWTRVGSIANSRNGAVAVFRGTPSAALSGVTTTVTETGGNQAYISVVAIAGASQTLGAVTAGSGSGSAASLTVNATAAGSWILAVGEDWNNTTRRTLSATTTPTLLDERSDPALNDYWVERAATTAAGSFRIGTSAPSTADWNMIAVEVVPAAATPTSPPPPAPAAAQPSISPAAGTYASSVTATITCPTAGTLPYRTTDGSTPTTSSTQSATATFSASGTLSAICAGTGYSPSPVSSAAYTVTTSTGGTGGTATGSPMTTAHRTSGVAPLAVFFDAVNTSPSGTAAPFTWNSGVYQPSDLEGTQYTWSFGDPGSGTWSATGEPKNVASGYTAAHVYETPGTYTVSLTQTDTAGTARTYVQTITVTAFSGTTYYVAANGNDAAAGTSEATPLRTVGRAMSVALATSGPVRVLFRRGDTFPVSAAYAITKPGPGIIGAYGTGNRPIFTVAELGDVNVFSPRGTGADWRIMDLDMRGPSLSTGTGPVGPDVSHQGVNLLVLRLRASNWYVGIGWGDWTPIYATPHDGMFVVDSESPGNGGYGMYVGGRRIALLGNTVSDPVQTHVCRVWQAHKGVISNNALLRPGGQRHALKLHGPEINDGRPETRWVSITDNFFQASGTSQWTVSMGSQSSALSESDPVSHVVLERNRFAGSASLVADIESEASHAMVRNNVFDDTAASSAVAVLWTQRNTGVPAPDDVRIYNNTVYDGTAGSGGSGLLQTDSSVTNLRVRNNLYGAATLSTVSLIQGAGGAGWAADHNLATSSPGFTNAAAGDFSLATGSPAVDAGAALRDAGLDYQLSARPRGAGYDLGAYESR
ncbi:PKD domain-containing protein [Anaeromyxobacter sp. PSR-1]|uniref:PKD domain-containing protein n=1 Tax=Anaeromyxobacter sp. PSR-1 TaxID=1300915 RepID=UPI0005E9F522|nr:PKD domain-containing protein [Anaeromyxobacter sp. PSR-1]GAO01909.1 PKD domain protein [Anaeromyxobacter sp. PSR-1]